MNRKYILSARELFVTQMNHWALFPVILAVIGIARNASECDEPNLWIWLAMGGIPLALYFLRILLRRFIFLLGGHIAVLLLFSFVLPTQNSQARMFYLFAGAGYVFYSFAQRLRSKDFLDGKIIMPVAVGLSAASAFFVNYLGFTEWYSYYLAALIAVFGLYFIASYLESYLSFLSVNASSTGHIPEREIFVSGSLLMGFFVFLSVVILFVASHLEWLRTVVDLLREIFVTVLRFLVALIPSEEPEISITETPSIQGGGMELPPSGETSLFWQILEYIAFIAFFCGLIYLMIWLLVRLIGFIRERMKLQRSTYMPQTWEKVYDVREKCEMEKTKKTGRRSLFARMSTEERIRRLYQSYIESAVKRLSMIPDNHENIDPALRTAREWGVHLEKEELAPLYEKARYSEEGVTTEDLRRMKEICKKKS